MAFEQGLGVRDAGSVVIREVGCVGATAERDVSFNSLVGSSAGTLQVSTLCSAPASALVWADPVIGEYVVD